MMLVAGQKGRGGQRAGERGRADPRPRPYDLGNATQSFKGLDPTKKQVMVNLADQTQGAEFYWDAGFRPVEESKNGPKNPFRQTKNGAYIERHGCVLMEIDREVAAQHDQYGMDGCRGQALADDISGLLKGQFRGESLGVADSPFDGRDAGMRLTSDASGKVLAEV